MLQTNLEQSLRLGKTRMSFCGESSELLCGIRVKRNISPHSHAASEVHRKQAQVTSHLNYLTAQITLQYPPSPHFAYSFVSRHIRQLLIQLQLANTPYQLIMRVLYTILNKTIHTGSDCKHTPQPLRPHLELVSYVKF